MQFSVFFFFLCTFWIFKIKFHKIQTQKSVYFQLDNILYAIVNILINLKIIYHTGFFYSIILVLFECFEFIKTKPRKCEFK